MSRFLLLTLILAGCTQAIGGSRTDLVPDDPEVTSIELPTSGIAGEPHLTRDNDGRILASWIEREEGMSRLVFSRLSDRSWTESREISSGDDWFVNWADVPSLAVSDKGVIMAHWLERLGESRYAYGVRFSLSDDAGMTWSDERWLHDDRSPSEHGFVSISPAADGFMASWLDGNRYGQGLNEMSVHARAISDSGELSDEISLDTRTCDCCPVSMSRTGDDEYAVFYRDRSEVEMRDIAVARFSNGSWSKPRAVHEDGWMIEACPVNGPASDTYEGVLGVSWFTLSGGAPTVNTAFSRDGGEKFSDPVQIDLGNPGGRVALRMRSANEMAVVWMEGAARDGSESESGMFLRTVSVSGEVGDPVRLTSSSTSRAAGYPRLERHGKDMLAAWTVPGEPATLGSALISW